jgi:putative tryptophan/tyrosine transport system substrate-binding protein
MRRREFIGGLGSAAASPLAARAQQDDRMRRIGVLMGWDENDPEVKVWLTGFERKLAGLGWTQGRNLRIDVRWTAGNVERARMLAKEMVDLQPDVVLAHSTPETMAVHRETRTIPIVFVLVSNPIGSGFLESLSRPGGNLTGFVSYEDGMASKWLELLTQIVPGIKRAAIMFNPDTAPNGGLYLLPTFEAAAQSLKVEPIIARVRDEADIEAVITSLGSEPKAGLALSPDIFLAVHRTSIISLAARNKVPAVYISRFFVRDGGLVSYGPDFGDIFSRTAPYVDRILRGAKPADLPVQLPIKFEIGINVKTAKALGVAVPLTLLALADEVIE